MSSEMVAKLLVFRKITWGNAWLACRLDPRLRGQLRYARCAGNSVVGYTRLHSDTKSLFCIILDIANSASMCCGESWHCGAPGLCNCMRQHKHAKVRGQLLQLSSARSGASVI